MTVQPIPLSPSTKVPALSDFSAAVSRMQDVLAYGVQAVQHKLLACSSMSSSKVAVQSMLHLICPSLAT